MKLFVIVNPTSGRGKSLRLLDKIVAILDTTGCEYELALTESHWHARDLARDAVARRFTRIVAVGGDGTAHQVLNGVFGMDVEIAVVPAGTGNDLACSLGVSRNLKTALETAVTGKATPIDVGEVGGRYFFQVAGAGIDSLINRSANETTWIKGREVYVYATIKTLLSFKAARFTVTTPDERLEFEGMMVAVGNGTSYGGGMRVTPNARYDDGELDLCIVEKVSLPHFLVIFPSVFRGTHGKSRHVKMRRSHSVRVESDQDFPIYADGEYVCQLPADFRVHPRAVPVVVPATAPIAVKERKPALGPAGNGLQSI